MSSVLSCARSRTVLLTLLVAIIGLVGASQAYALATFSGMTPAAGSVATTARPTISVTALDTAPIWLGTSSWLKVDGATVRATVTYGTLPGGGIDNRRVTFTYTPTSNLSAANHTVQASVFSGLRSTYAWTFRVSPKPTLSSPQPVNGTTVASTTPAVSVGVVPGQGQLTVSALVDGEDAPAFFNAAFGRIDVELPQTLENDRQHTVAVTAANAYGSTTLTWGFGVQVYSAMPVQSDCWTCHPTYPAEHPMDDCAACHSSDASSGGGTA